MRKNKKLFRFEIFMFFKRKKIYKNKNFWIKIFKKSKNLFF